MFKRCSEVIWQPGRIHAKQFGAAPRTVIYYRGHRNIRGKAVIFEPTYQQYVGTTNMRIRETHK